MIFSQLKAYFTLSISIDSLHTWCIKLSLWHCVKWCNVKFYACSCIFFCHENWHWLYFWTAQFMHQVFMGQLICFDHALMIHHFFHPHVISYCLQVLPHFVLSYSLNPASNIELESLDVVGHNGDALGFYGLWNANETYLTGLVK